MKSTYKLLSIYLDKQSLPSSSPVIQDVSLWSECADLREDSSVFDFPICKRKVSGKFLLSEDIFLPIQNFINRLLVCHEIIIVWDYESNSLVANLLFAKRLLQLSEILRANNPGIRFMHAASDCRVPFYQKMIEKFY